MNWLINKIFVQKGWTQLLWFLGNASQLIRLQRRMNLERVKFKQSSISQNSRIALVCNHNAQRIFSCCHPGSGTLGDTAGALLRSPHPPAAVALDAESSQLFPSQRIGLSQCPGVGVLPGGKGWGGGLLVAWWWPGHTKALPLTSMWNQPTGQFMPQNSPDPSLTEFLLLSLHSSFPMSTSNQEHLNLCL